MEIFENSINNRNDDKQTHYDPKHVQATKSKKAESR